MLDATTAITGEWQRFFLVHYENFVVTQKNEKKIHSFRFSIFFGVFKFSLQCECKQINNKTNIPVKHRTSTLTTN